MAQGLHHKLAKMRINISLVHFLLALIIHLSFGSLSAKPSDSVAETYNRFQELGNLFLAELKKTGWPEDKQNMNAPEVLRAASNFLDALYSEINIHMSNMESLFKVLKTQMPKFKLSDESPTQRQSLDKIFARLDDVFHQYLTFQIGETKLVQLIKRLRSKNPKLLNSENSQQLLSVVLADAISFFGIQSIHSHFLNGGVPSILDHTLDDIVGLTQATEVNSAADHYFEKTPGEEFKAKVDIYFLHQLLLELKKNAGEATLRRRGNLNSKTRPTSRLLKDSAGRIVIQIEDGGNPEEWQNAKGIGYTTQGVMQSDEAWPQRIGVGIGMFRSQIFAEVQGMEIQRSPKPDGEGTITNIIIGFHPSKICGPALAKLQRHAT